VRISCRSWAQGRRRREPCQFGIIYIDNRQDRVLEMDRPRWSAVARQTTTEADGRNRSSGALHERLQSHCKRVYSAGASTRHDQHPAYSSSSAAVGSFKRTSGAAVSVRPYRVHRATMSSCWMKTSFSNMSQPGLMELRTGSSRNSSGVCPLFIRNGSL